MSTFVLIEKYTVGAGGASSVTLGSGGTIPQTYTDLKIVASIRTNRTATNAENIRLQFNGDTASNYSWRYLDGNGSSATSVSGSANASILIAYADTDLNTSNTFGNLEIYAPNYTSSNAKSVSGDSVSENNASLGYQVLAAGLWSGTSAIASVKLFPQLGPNFMQYSTFYLYGILKA
jgi:hypothetical protein